MISADGDGRVYFVTAVSMAVLEEGMVSCFFFHELVDGM